MLDRSFWLLRPAFGELDPGGGGGGSDGGGGGDSPSYPYGPGDPPPGWGQPAPPVNANPGPSRGGGYSGGGGGGGGGGGPQPAPPPDIFAGYSGPAVDQASQLARQFVSLMGFSSGLDVNSLALQLLQNGSVMGSAQQAMDFMFYQGMGMTGDMRNSHPWAQFALDQNAYQARKETLDQTFQSLVGVDPTFEVADPNQHKAGMESLQELYFLALKSNWSQSELLGHLQNDQQFAQLRIDQPWITAGQGEQQASQSFSSIYGSAPVDTSTLASWWRFNTGTATLSRTNAQALQSATPTPATAETR